MASALLGKALAVVACLMLLHAGYSVYEYLSILKALGTPATGIPRSIQLEAILSFLIFIPGIVLASAPLEEVTWRAEMAKRANEDSDARMAFVPLGPAYRQAMIGERIECEQ